MEVDRTDELAAYEADLDLALASIMPAGATEYRFASSLSGMTGTLQGDDLVILWALKDKPYHSFFQPLLELGWERTWAFVHPVTGYTYVMGDAGNGWYSMILAWDKPFSLEFVQACNTFKLNYLLQLTP